MRGTDNLGRWDNTYLSPANADGGLLFKYVNNSWSSGVIYDKLDDTIPLSESIRSNFDILFQSPFGGSFDFGSRYNNLGLVTNNDLIQSAIALNGVSFTDPNQVLTINITPLEGGNITGEGISCNVDTSSICQYSITQGSQVSLTANANCGWAFGSWDNGSAITDNPYTFNMPSENQTLYAKFFRTFRNATGSFYDTSGTYGDGECVTYVKHETGVTTLTGEAFSGDAYTYFQKAIDNGYATGSTPRIGAIIVFDQVPNTALEHGHVGVVTAINGINVTMEDQNWVATYTIGSHTVDVSQYDIKGYIYYTP